MGAAEPAEVWEHGARRRRSTVAGLMLLREFPQPARLGCMGATVNLVFPRERPRDVYMLLA